MNARTVTGLLFQVFSSLLLVGIAEAIPGRTTAYDHVLLAAVPVTPKIKKDEKGRIIERIHQRRGRRYKYTYKYDDSNRLIERAYYTPDGFLAYRYDYKYHTDGTVTEEKYNSGGFLQKKRKLKSYRDVPYYQYGRHASRPSRRTKIRPKASTEALKKELADQKIKLLKMLHDNPAGAYTKLRNTYHQYFHYLKDYKLVAYATKKLIAQKDKIKYLPRFDESFLYYVAIKAYYYQRDFEKTDQFFTKASKLEKGRYLSAIASYQRLIERRKLHHTPTPSHSPQTPNIPYSIPQEVRLEIKALFGVPTGQKISAIKRITNMPKGKNKHALSYLRGLASDPSPQVRTAILEALGKIGTRDDVHNIIKFLNDPKRKVIIKTIKVLAALKDSRAVQPLIKKLSSKDLTIRLAAIHTLGTIVDFRAVGPLIELIKDKNPQVRTTAYTALKRITLKDFGLNYTAWDKWHKGIVKNK